MRWLVRILSAALLLAFAGGCSSDDTDPGHTDTRGTNYDGYTWPDYGPLPKYDIGQTKYDKGPQPKDIGSSDKATPTDGAPPVDGSPSCPNPSGAKCTSGCSTGQICTAASGGTCAKIVTLTGKASDKAVMVKIVEAYVECYSQSPIPAKDVVCAAFDTCNLSGTITDKVVDTWICKQAQVSDFANSKILDTAKDIASCSIIDLVNRSDWQINAMATGKKAQTCLTYDLDATILNVDKLDINDCSLFPPK